MAGRALIVLAIVVICGAVFGVYLISRTPVFDDEKAVRTLVEDFGRRLKSVSLLADTTMVADALHVEYGPFVATALLAEWQNNPFTAPGRLTSSPWPDRIDIERIAHEKRTRYIVEGSIVEVTNEGGDVSAPGVAHGRGSSIGTRDIIRRPVTLVVEKLNSSWRITRLTLGAYEGDSWTLSSTTPQGIQFMYPLRLPTAFISTWQWPPDVRLEGGVYSCAEGEERMIARRLYCISESVEGAAGSMYRSFVYTTKQGDFLARVEFTLRFPQCTLYDEGQRRACQVEAENFDIDGMVDRMTQSIRML